MLFDETILRLPIDDDRRVAGNLQRSGVIGSSDERDNQTFYGIYKLLLNAVSYGHFHG
jgi:hypothetical protein